MMTTNLRSRLLGALLAVAVTAVWAGAGVTTVPATQSASQPATSQAVFTGVGRIVAVGDVHGDFGQFVGCLRAAGVIDKDNNWIAGQTHLVQTGDVLDRGAESRKAMDLLMKMEAQAAKAGGAVHALLGNHEALVLLGDWRYVVPGEIDAFGGEEQYKAAMSATGVYGRWIRTHNTVVRINDVLFCHAGISETLADWPLEKINDTVRRDLDGTIEAASLAMGNDGPLWNRRVANDPDEGELDTVFKAQRARHMVVGHSVNTRGIIPYLNGRLIRIDVGLVFGGPTACLVIDKGVFYQVTPDGREKLDMGAGSQTKPATMPTTSVPASRLAA